MKMLRQTSHLAIVLFALSVILFSVTGVSAAPSVTLTVLNSPNDYGDISVVRGNSVEVELTVVDPLNESSSQDLIRLARVSDGAVASQQRRGKELSGSRSLGTQKTTGNDVLGELQVQYISATTKQVIAVSDKNVFLVDNQAVMELTERTSKAEAKAAAAQTKADDLQAQADELRARADAADNERYAAKLEREAAKLEREAAKLERIANAAAAQEAKNSAAAADSKATAADSKATAADTKATSADTKATAAQTKADDLQAQADELRARADAADNERYAAKLEREAAKLEREAAKLERIANAAAAQEAKNSAAAADSKATAADSKATAAQTAADAAMAASTDLQVQVDAIPSAAAQSCPSGQHVTGFDANGNVICDICAPVSGPSAMYLLAYYPLDGDVFDAGAYNYDGTVGGTETYAAGYSGQAFYFNGATYISTMLDIDVGVQPKLTMGAWVRPDAGTFYGQVLTHDDQGFDRSLIHYGADWRAYDGGAGGSVHTGPITATDEWQFVAVVYDQDMQTVTLYVDGSSYMKAGQVLGPSVNMFRMGNNESNGVEFFRGLVDEVFVVSGALSVFELDQIRLNGVRSVFP